MYGGMARLKREPPEIGWTMVTVPEGQNAASFAERLLKTGGVRWAEPDMTCELHAAPAVERYGEQWGFSNIQAEAGWDITTGSADVIVAIVDTGVDAAHPEFAGKAFVDGYNAANSVGTGDQDGHGTHVAGIAADDGRNGKIAGVAWDCPILPVKVMDTAGNIQTSYLTSAMVYLGDYAQSHPGKRIVANMSIGGRGYSIALKDAIDYAAQRGVLLVTSAGNDGKRAIGFPSAYNGVVCVAASTPRDARAQFSTFGFWNSLAAPGEQILSTVPGGGYESWQGTSMASPFVAGAAALVLSKYPNLTPLGLKNQLEQTARGTQFSEDLGYGILNISAALGSLRPMIYGSMNVTTNVTDSVYGYGVIAILNSSGKLVGFGACGENGNYYFHALKPGTYLVKVTYYNPTESLYTMTSKSASVGVNGVSNVNFNMPVANRTIP